ncbi:calcium channel protein CCH1 [Aspergillus clavatus NRRL 1]|uniref:Calcium-channel protein CCH1 n=1 Tax=Aspergillus clavatus (strain ATCC 1007 / CBS 513.65 / DSM 816 / NCTC 3887 / NRRL 1 / QM 1276 / 107) TaxID=344612 RepID=A1CQ08_ASPCL|nr:calcium channel subunit Cch1 [Aspergillus clavatus NRRL 1]EAW07729.1 calcium channel subunit Cch1 [Aspergillus clavatus NRRL 1]
MASSSHHRGHNDEDNASADYSIPLQDLSGPSERSEGRIGRVGSRFLSRRSLRRGGSLRNYERVSEDSPVEPPPVARHARPHHAAPGDEDVFHVEDPGTFAQAMSSVGLSFDPTASTTSLARRRESSSSMTIVPLDDYGPQEAEHYLSPSHTYGTDDDTARLTDQRYLQPISGASNPPKIETDHGSTHGDPFPGDSHSEARLGDDLPHLESGLGRRRRGSSSAGESRARSLSPSAASGSALQRAGSMMKSMSQRVVNLSNEPEVVEQAIMREEQHKSARLEEPPSLPSLSGYAHDAPSVGMPDTQIPRTRASSSKAWRLRNNPLRGKSLGVLGPDNPLRVRLCDILVHPFTEPFILVVIIIQTILLTIESSESVQDHPRSVRWGKDRLDYAYLVIFIIYTLELIAKILVSGFMLNPAEYSTLNRSLGFRKAVSEKAKNLIAPQRQFTSKQATSAPEPQQASIIRTFTGGFDQLQEEVVDDPLQRRRVRLAHRAFLRHSFNRLDFVAVVSFWVSFLLSLTSVENRHQLYVFRMLSCLRILRLLALTNGTSVILRSLKKAAPLLVHVAFLIGFFWLLFAIVGIQSFKSSFRRSCRWLGRDGQSDFDLNDPSGTLQFCGGYLNATTGAKESWLKTGLNGELVSSGSEPKGYLCPQGSICVENTNPYEGTVNFDDIVHSLELVFVIMSSNTFTDLLYYTTNSDYLAAALFFACGFVILSLWLVNLLVAVITHSFQVIREESKRSAFAVHKLDTVDKEDTSTRKISSLKRLYDKTQWFWVCIIIFDLVVQALRSSTMEDDRVKLISDVEIIVTVVLLVEIILRFASDWRVFHRSRRNWVDLGLVVITCVIQIPAIRGSGRSYDVLTLFQILRVYRVVLAFSVTRNLIMVVFRNATGLLNLIMFVFLITFLASIFATQLFRGQTPDDEDAEITFADIYNSFIGMYQILSSENWTTILYNSTTFTYKLHTAWISAIFFIIWFIVANFIVLNMFIAVIQESFDVSEDEKRLQQVRAFLEQKHVNGASQGNLSLSKILMLGRDSNRYRDPLDHGPAALEMLLKDAVVREFLDEQEETTNSRRRQSVPLEAAAGATGETVRPGMFSRMWTTITTSLLRREPNPFYSKLKFSRAYEELDPKEMAQAVVSAAEQRKRAQREYLMRHPSYNKSLFIFAPDNAIRRLCQRIVGPGRGHQRVEGVDPYKPVWYTFSAFVYAAIVAMVLIACITTPIYQRHYQAQWVTKGIPWYVYTDMGFAILFTFEALIKVIADGFFWTPNAYFRSSWGFIDGIVLVTLWINVGSSLFWDLGISRAIGAFKALRALRLLNVSDSAKDTFHSVIIIGGWKVIAAAAVSMSFLIPFAIYGVTLYNGQMVTCNDGSIVGSLNQCINEYSSSPYNWEVLAPRAASNPLYDFDNFGNALFILFQIVSQEGWTDVQMSAMSITGKDWQPQSFAAPANGLFFIVFNLLGAVFVLTLFVSVFMRNYTEQTGVAFLTAEQRSWLELRKLLRQISPSKRSLDRKSTKWKLWCYRIAVKKHGRWARCVTTILLLHLLLLILEYYPEPHLWELTRESLFFAFTFFYIANTLIRLFGLGWHRFSRSSWDLYSLIAVPGTFITTILNFLLKNQVIMELNKLFLVSITLLLIPRNNQLDQLFKTAAASLTAIGNLLATWFVLFLVFAIAMNQAFGLTKFGEHENNNINFRDIPRTLILLFRMSCGEGWNAIMEDFATMVPPFCTYDRDFFNDDCGSAAWARPLFISWNIISMYIFVSLFVSLIFESFSYVYQRSSGLYAISREEIRRFKQAWATYDPDGTGYISKEQFPRLLGELSGDFSMRIYDDQFSIGRILEKCSVDKRDSLLAHRRVVEGLDLDKMAKILRQIPVATVRKRRQELNRFFEEVLVSADPVRGISFHSVLMILAHYKIISDSKSLRLEEFLRRRARLQRVEEAVRRNTVIGFFDTLYWSREFRRRVNAKKSARMSEIPQFTVPEIFVDDGYQDEPERVTEESGSRVASPEPVSFIDGGGQPMLSPTSPIRSSGSPTSSRQLPRLDTNLAGRMSNLSSPTEWSSISPSLSPSGRARSHTISSYDAGPDLPASPGGADQSREGSAMNVQEVMQSLDDSAWGESIRRSFTQRRSTNS